MAHTEFRSEAKGRDMVRQIRAAMEKQANEVQLKGDQMEVTLNESQIKCLLAISTNSELGTFENLAAAAGLDRQEAEDVTLRLDDIGLLDMTYTSFRLNRNGRDAVRQIKTAQEKLDNESQV